MRAVTQSLKLITPELRQNTEAILGSSWKFSLARCRDHAAPDERKRRAWAIRACFGRIVEMMQFNMYHHYTVDEHLLRCIGILSDIEAGRSEDTLRYELMRTIQPAASHAALCCVVSP